MPEAARGFAPPTAAGCRLHQHASGAVERQREHRRSPVQNPCSTAGALSKLTISRDREASVRMSEASVRMSSAAIVRGMPGREECSVRHTVQKQKCPRLASNVSEAWVCYSGRFHTGGSQLHIVSSFTRMAGLRQTMDCRTEVERRHYSSLYKVRAVGKVHLQRRRQRLC